MNTYSQQQKEILKLFSPGFGGTVVPDWIKPYLQNGLGGVTLFGSNVPTLEAAQKLIEDLRKYNPDLVISIDEEGGDVTRIFANKGSPFPSAALLGRIENESFTEESFFNLGSYLAKLDIDLTLAPVADIVKNKKNPIVGIRAFGSTPRKVALQVTSAVKGLHKAGISACVKHFPGHGAAVEDSHLHLPKMNCSAEELWSVHLIPFIESINKGVDAILIGHLLVNVIDPDNSASLSRKIMQDLLRNELKFQGVIMTDALDMGAIGGPNNLAKSAFSAISNGADFLCFSGLPDQERFISQSLDLVNNGIKNNSELINQIQQSGKRIDKLRRNKIKSTSIHPLNLKTIQAGFQISGINKISTKSATYLKIESDPTIAAGKIDWGFDNLKQYLDLKLEVVENSDIPDLVLFRDAWRTEALLNKLREFEKNRTDIIFIDMGWPTEEFKPRNLIRTFGVSEIVSQAVLDLIFN